MCVVFLAHEDVLALFESLSSHSLLHPFKINASYWRTTVPVLWRCICLGLGGFIRKSLLLLYSKRVFGCLPGYHAFLWALIAFPFSSFLLSGALSFPAASHGVSLSGVMVSTLWFTLKTDFPSRDSCWLAVTFVQVVPLAGRKNVPSSFQIFLFHGRRPLLRLDLDSNLTFPATRVDCSRGVCSNVCFLIVTKILWDSFVFFRPLSRLLLASVVPWSANSKHIILNTHFNFSMCLILSCFFTPCFLWAPLKPSPSWWPWSTWSSWSHLPNGPSSLPSFPKKNSMA